MRLEDYVDVDLLHRMVDEGYISSADHPEYPLTLYNYTHNTQFQQMWNQATARCRGLIADDNGEIVARPFPKFYNIEEHASDDPLFTETPLVLDKLDGTLGIGFYSPAGYEIATRGVWHSEQSVRANEILRRKYSGWQPAPGFTYLFEIIYPENRIVVDYNDTEDLFFLAALSLDDVHHEILNFGNEHDWPGPRAELYEIGDLHPKELKWLEDENREGYVLFFPRSCQRVKIKFEEYVRLHKLVTQCSNVTIWEHLKDNRHIEDLTERVPDEFYEWVRTTINEILSERQEIIDQATADFYKCKSEVFEPTVNRREFAEHAKQTEYPALVFALLDGKHDKFDQLVWKMIRPEWSPPFFQNTEDI